MAFRDSPGISINEKDRSLFVDSDSGTEIGIVVDSNKGFVGETSSDQGIKELNTPDDYKREYPEPTSLLERTAKVILRATSKMEGAVRLFVKRALPTDNNDDIDALWSGLELDTSTSPEQLTALSTGEVYPVESYSPSTDTKFAIFADNPGTWGDNVGIEIDNSVGASDEFQVIVYTRDDSTSSWEQEETHFVSQNKKKDAKNRQMFLEDRINADSDIIKAVNNSNDNTDLTEDSYGTTALGGGADGSSVTKTNLVDAVQTFRDENIPLTALVSGGQTSLNDTTFADEIIDVVASRGDSIALVDVPFDVDVSDATSTYLSTLSFPTGEFADTYAYSYYGWHNDTERQTGESIQNPPSGYVAEALAVVRDQNRPWSPVAGVPEALVSSEGLYRSPLSRSDRDELYRNHINYFRERPTTGPYIDGTKNHHNITAGTKMDRMNTRLLLNYIQRNIRDFLVPYKHELNTPSTRREIRQGIFNFLDRVEGRQGLNPDGKEVICDTSNNTQSVIDSKELVVDVIIDPTVVAENLKVNNFVTETGGVEQTVEFI